MEDSPLSQQLNVKLLKDYGKVVLAENGKEGLKVYSTSVSKKEFYDIIFVDYYLGDMEGSEVITEIRKLEESKNLNKVKIVLVSGGINDSNLQDITSCGLDLILEKPLCTSKIASLFET